MSKDKIEVSMNVYDIPILVEALEKANKEIERLNKELELYKDNHEHLNNLLQQKDNIIKELDKQNVELGTKLSLTTDKYEKKLFIKENIIKEVREYIEDDRFYMSNGDVLSIANTGCGQKILEILDKEKDNE